MNSLPSPSPTLRLISLPTCLPPHTSCYASTLLPCTPLLSSLGALGVPGRQGRKAGELPGKASRVMSPVQPLHLCNEVPFGGLAPLVADDATERVVVPYVAVVSVTDLDTAFPCHYAHLQQERWSHPSESPMVLQKRGGTSGGRKEWRTEKRAQGREGCF